MQKTVANILKIIKEFILEARPEKAFTIAAIVALLISGSKISLYQLGLKTTKRNIRLKSKEQKIRRILDKFPITSKIYAKAVFSLFSVNSSIELIINRTNWKFGQTYINYLLLSIRWNSISIPIYWIMLDNKGGNSSSEQRISLVNWFITNFYHITIDNIYADREFPSVKFISWLLHKDRNINFILRTKNSIQASDGNKKVSLAKLYHKLHSQQHKYKIECMIRRIFGNRLYIANKIKPIAKKKIKQANGTKIIRPDFTLFKYGFYWLKNFFDNFLCDSAVVALQLYHILNYPPETIVSRDLRIANIIAAV